MQNHMRRTATRNRLQDAPQQILQTRLRHQTPAGVRGRAETAPLGDRLLCRARAGSVRAVQYSWGSAGRVLDASANTLPVYRDDVRQRCCRRSARWKRVPARCPLLHPTPAHLAATSTSATHTLLILFFVGLATL